MKKQAIKLFTLIITTCTLLCTCNQHKEEMNAQTFWQLTDTIREKSGTDMELRYHTLITLLTEYEPVDILRFKNIADIYASAAAENTGIWAACKAMEGMACDDIYMNFCCWLITEGEKTYLHAVKNPETLATKEILAYNEHSIELLSFAAFDAYKQKTGTSVDDISDSMADMLSAEYKQLTISLLKDIEFMDDTPFGESKIEVIQQIPVILPKLTNMFNFNAEAEIQALEEENTKLHLFI